MKTQYFCVNCNRPVGLSVRGSCDQCGSFALIEEPGYMEPVYLPERHTPWYEHVGAFIGACAFLGCILWLYFIFSGARFK